jgi:hypothetical protein
MAPSSLAVQKIFFTREILKRWCGRLTRIGSLRVPGLYFFACKAKNFTVCLNYETAFVSLWGCSSGAHGCLWDQVSSVVIGSLSLSLSLKKKFNKDDDIQEYLLKMIESIERKRERKLVIEKS